MKATQKCVQITKKWCKSNEFYYKLFTKQDTCQEFV